MIITREHGGQPCLDSSSEKKVPWGDIVLPQQSYFPERYFDPVLHINTGYVESISSASGAPSEVTSDSDPTDLSTTQRRKRWRLFNSSHLFKKRPPEEDLLSGSTVVEKPRRARKHRSPFSWAELSRKWLVGWILFSLLLCLVVALSVWLATRRAYRDVFFHSMNSEWSPKDSGIYTFPPELFGCHIETPNSAPNISQFLVPVPPGQAGQHTFTIRGGASGQITLASAPDPNAPAITYDIVIQSNPPSPNTVSFNHPPPPGSVPPPSTDFFIDTPITMTQQSPSDPPPCMRFEITVYIPRSLRQLTVNVSTPAQIIFSPQAHIELESLSIFIKNPHPRSRIDSTESVQAKSIFVEMDTGSIHGLLSLGEKSTITNWGGQIQLDAIPNASMDFVRPSTARLETTTSYGNVEIHYLRNNAYRRRPIESWHTMGTLKNNTGRFDYGCSGFNGLVYSNSSEYNATSPGFWKTKRLESVEEGPWPFMIGNRTGEDRIYIRSGSGSIVLPDSSHI